MTGFLASITSVEEAALVVDSADIIDLKNPALGALGALPNIVVEKIVRFVDGCKPVSATVGDLPMNPELMRSAVLAKASVGVDIVKVGFFERGEQAPCLRALREVAGKCKLVAVLFADRSPDMRILKDLATAGFFGVMLDTAGKDAGNLRTFMDDADLAAFIDQAKSLGFLTGLAGSLRQEDIATLVDLTPDYLGFRGALCRDQQRVSALDFQALKSVESVLRRCNKRGVGNALQLHS